MKKLLLSIVAITVMASCSKNEDYTIVDNINNQGKSIVTVGTITLSPGESIIVPHQSSYLILCGVGCRVNINGAIYYESGQYTIDLYSKQKN